MVLIAPITTEKATKLLQQNVLVFEVDMRVNKQQIKNEFEKTFNVQVEKINTMIRKGKKIAFIKLKKKFNAADIASKLGML